MDIYADPITVNCRKVFAGLKMMGVDYDQHHIDYFTAQQKTPEYTAINPNQSLPAMKDGDLVLWESNAILQYAADKNGKDEFYPHDAATRSDINRWMFWESAQWFPSTYVYLVENCVKPVLGAEPDPAILDGERERFDRLAGILNDRLAGRQYIMGDSITIADIAVAAPMHLYGWQQLPLGDYPNIVSWMQRIEALPFWKATHVAEGFKFEPKS